MDDLISRQAAIDALDVLCQEHRYKIPGKRETYSQYNEAWQDALDRAEGAIFNLPSAQETHEEHTETHACDLISRRQAIDYCYQLINVEHQQGSDEMNYGQERVNQTETILHHLELMPSAQLVNKSPKVDKESDELISRQAAIDSLHMHLMYRMGTDSNKKRLDEWINNLPSAQPNSQPTCNNLATDCISRQGVIDVLSEYPFEKVVNCISIIEEFPSAQPYTEEQIQKMQDMEQAQLEEAYRLGRESAQQWTPCSERLPKVNESVLATTVWNYVTIAWRIGVDKWFIHDGGTNATTEDLFAWMPLPEPYKAERREE